MKRTDVSKALKPNPSEIWAGEKQMIVNAEIRTNDQRSKCTDTSTRYLEKKHISSGSAGL
jgi:hypothetical protein